MQQRCRRLDCNSSYGIARDGDRGKIIVAGSMNVDRLRTLRTHSPLLNPRPLFPPPMRRFVQRKLRPAQLASPEISRPSSRGRWGKCPTSITWVCRPQTVRRSVGRIAWLKTPRRGESGEWIASGAGTLPHSAAHANLPLCQTASGVTPRADRSCASMSTGRDRVQQRPHGVHVAPTDPRGELGKASVA